MTATLDLGRIQGFVVRGYRLPFAGYIFLRIDDAVAARAWIAHIGEETLTAAPWSRKPESGVNVAFSFAGLRALELPDASLAGFPEEFRQGMAARAELLGDIDESAPTRWEGSLGTTDIHVLVIISAMSREALEAHDRQLRDAVERIGGVSFVGEQRGAALAGGTEHFGFADGFAQPAIEGSGVEALPGQGAVTGDGGWRALRAGEFILGYPDEEGVLPPAPPPAALSTNGSYLVYRKLHQDVAGFRACLSTWAENYPGGEELLAAKIVGRWRDGTPLDLSPDGPDTAIASDERANNNFHYGADPDGRICPVGAHVRRANPRNSLPFDGKLVNRHRLLRRGIPYGEPLPPGHPDDGAERGVVFMCLQASIARQFEFVQSEWLNRGNVFGRGEDQDVLLGPQDCRGTAKMTIPGEKPYLLGPLPRLVTVKGGEYFFVPGTNGLQFIAAAAGAGAA